MQPQEATQPFPSLWLFNQLGRSCLLNASACFKSSEGQRVSAQSQSGWRGWVFELATSWQGGDGVKGVGEWLLEGARTPASSKRGAFSSQDTGQSSAAFHNPATPLLQAHNSWWQGPSC